MKKVVWSAGPRLAGALMVMVATASCGTLTRQGQGSSYLILSSLNAAPGAGSAFGGTLASDVVTRNSVFADSGQASFQLAMKDATSVTGPSTANYITIDRYHVAYVRTDGHNVEGVDVPYAFDGAVTATVGSGTTTVTFIIVRVQAKEEAPLRALRGTLVSAGIAISTIADVTFYGHDQTGRDVSVGGKISITFADFGDGA